MDILKKKYHLNGEHRMSWWPSLLIVLTIMALVSSPCQCCPQLCTCVTNKVNCAGNSLTSLPPDFPLEMTELDFSNNKLMALGSQAFIKYTNLESLDLSNNNIASVEVDAFDSLTKLRKIYLQGNQLRGLPANSFTDLGNVHTVELSRNPLDGFPKGVFESCTRLSILKVIDAGLGPQAFGDMLNVQFLVDLDISGNHFPYLPYRMLPKYSRLTHLTISNAGVKAIDPNAFVGLLSLTQLKLNGNNISRISREVFQPLGQISSLDLNGNPLVCDCGTAQFKDWDTQIGPVISGSPTCLQSDGEGLDIKKVKLSEFCSAVGPPTTPPPCGEDVKLNMKLSELRYDRVTVIWQVNSVPGDLLISTIVRLYGEGIPSKGARREDLTASQGSHVFTGLTPGSPYVLCFLQSECALYSCIDFTTEPDPQVGALKDPVCITAEVTAGVAAAAAFITLTIGMITIYLILRGVCCCPGQNKDDLTPPPSPGTSYGPSKRTQHVMPMQLSHSYIPSSHPRLQSSSSAGDTYDAIPLQPMEIDPSSYRWQERPRNVNDPLPIPDNGISNRPEQLTGSPNSTHQMMIQGISSDYLHQPTDAHGISSISTGPTAPETYLEPTETLKRRPSTKRPDMKLRHTTNDIISNSDPYHVYQEAMDDVMEDITPPRPRSSEDQASPATLKKQFTNKLPSLDEMRRNMETGTGRLKKFRRPVLQGDSRSISTPNILTATDKTLGTHQIQSEA